MPPYCVVGKILDAKKKLKCLSLHNIEKHALLVKGNVGNFGGSREKV